VFQDDRLDSCRSPNRQNVNAERMPAYANPVEVVIEGKLTGSLDVLFAY
jgi:hypothetical protein